MIGSNLTMMVQAQKYQYYDILYSPIICYAELTVNGGGFRMMQGYGKTFWCVQACDQMVTSEIIISFSLFIFEGRS